MLQRRVVTVVVITSTGGVSSHTAVFDDPIDPGLANWAAQYLNEQVSGLTLGTHLLRQRFEAPGLSPREREFLAAIRSAFTELLGDDQRLYVGGAGDWLDEVPDEELGLYRRLLATLEKRAALLEVLGHALDPRRPFVRVGDELAHPAFHDVALVGATYGLTNQVLGAVSLLGPVRMDYDKAIRSVRGAALELSRFVEEVYEDN
jgi:heat-inducible transcriptional repressor